MRSCLYNKEVALKSLFESGLSDLLSSGMRDPDWPT